MWAVCRLLVQMDQAALAHQVLFRRHGERSEDSNMDCRGDLRAGGHRQEATQCLDGALHNFQVLSLTLFEKIPLFPLLSKTDYILDKDDSGKQRDLFENLMGH